MGRVSLCCCLPHATASLPGYLWVGCVNDNNPPRAAVSSSPHQTALQFHPSQANNAYVFPAVGAAAMLTRAVSLPDEVFLEAAEALAAMATREQLSQGMLLPPLSMLRPASEVLAAHLASFMVEHGLGVAPAAAAAARDGARPPRTPAEWLIAVRDAAYVAPGAAPGDGGAAAAAALQAELARNLGAVRSSSGHGSRL